MTNDFVITVTNATSRDITITFPVVGRPTNPHTQTVYWTNSTSRDIYVDSNGTMATEARWQDKAITRGDLVDVGMLFLLGLSLLVLVVWLIGAFVEKTWGKP